MTEINGYGSMIACIKNWSEHASLWERSSITFKRRIGKRESTLCASFRLAGRKKTLDFPAIRIVVDFFGTTRAATLPLRNDYMMEAWFSRLWEDWGRLMA